MDTDVYHGIFTCARHNPTEDSSVSLYPRSELDITFIVTPRDIILGFNRTKSAIKYMFYKLDIVLSKDPSVCCLTTQIFRSKYGSRFSCTHSVTLSHCLRFGCVDHLEIVWLDMCPLFSLYITKDQEMLKMLKTSRNDEKRHLNGRKIYGKEMSYKHFSVVLKWFPENMAFQM